MKRWLVLALAFASLVTAQPLFAWGAQGHRVIADIAWANINPSTRAAIRQLLRAAPALDTPECKLASLRDAAVWPDCIRGEGQRWAFSFPWHYQDAPACAVDFAPTAACPGGNCVTVMIRVQRALLANRAKPAAERLAALAFLAHFVGDIHQPFHAVALAGDRGGNAEEVANAAALGGAADRSTNLHMFWDMVMAKRALAGGVWLDRAYSPAERARLAGGGPSDWARESWRIAVTTAYPQALGHRPCPGVAPASVTMPPATVIADLPMVRERLVRAGLRLAKMLDATLG